MAAESRISLHILGDGSVVQLPASVHDATSTNTGDFPEDREGGLLEGGAALRYLMNANVSDCLIITPGC